MLRPTPLHPRTHPLCTSWKYKGWSGRIAACAYDGHSEREYFAARHAATLMDASPLTKVEVRGPDAARLLARVCTRDIARDFGVGRVTYTALCDERGHLLDDGTVAHLGPDWFRLCTSEPSEGWLLRHGRRLDVQIADTTESVACLAVQGPRALAVLAGLVDFDLRRMRFFRVRSLRLAGLPVQISRTGYTGDLGFELWCAAEDAVAVWDAVLAAGAPHGLVPMGLDALDVLRIEAGYVLQGVDYTTATACPTDAWKSTPDEAGLGGTVDLDGRAVRFVGQAAVERERAAGPAWALVGLDVDLPALEALYESYGVPPYLAPIARREAVPVYAGEAVAGQATSHTWSPTLKRQLALATVRAAHAQPGTSLDLEWTVEHERRRVRATVVPRPFFDPPRKRALGGEL